MWSWILSPCLGSEIRSLWTLGVCSLSLRDWRSRCAQCSHVGPWLSDPVIGGPLCVVHANSSEHYTRRNGDISNTCTPGSTVNLAPS